MLKKIYYVSLLIVFLLAHAKSFSDAIRATDNTINRAVLHKIILCTGPSYGRKELLIETTQRDMKLIPFKKIFVATNDSNNLDLEFNGYKPICFLFSMRDKQLDCLNCIINSLKRAVNDEECLDDDIILFKHESTFINDMYLVKKAIGKIIDGYDIVIKNWIGFEDRIDSTHLKDYCHTDCFFIKVSAARTIFKNCAEVAGFIKGDFHFCEEYFTKYVVNKLPKPYKIDYRHSSWKDNELGLYHIPRYEHDPNWYWNKANYNDLYK